MLTTESTNDAQRIFKSSHDANHRQCQERANIVRCSSANVRNLYALKNFASGRTFPPTQIPMKSLVEKQGWYFLDFGTLVAKTNPNKKGK
jgi:hypothetical protein